MPRTAVVFGATGAIGEQLWRHLASDAKWSTVVTIGRRPPNNDAGPHSATVKHVKLDLEQLGTPEAEAAMAGADAVFCALGTTRGTAGSADAFKRVDLDYVSAAAEAAKKAGAKYFGLVSSQGANAKLWAADFVLFHPLLYARTKGQAEEAVKSQGFEAVGIFRPGLLDRGAKARSAERTFNRLVSSIAVADVAKVMVADADRFLSTGGPLGVKVYEMAAIQMAAKAGTPPQ